MALCKDCSYQEGCWAKENAKIYGITTYGPVLGENAMMFEIYQRGPYKLYCLF